MDSSLKWKQHIDETERKVTNTITALSSVGSSTWGVMTREMRTIYKGVAIPQMMYACSLWSNSGWGEMGYTKRTLHRLQRLQARAARAMSGAYRATSFPALDVEMHLLPVEQQIWKHNTDAISRMDKEQSVNKHERIPPYITPPWWRGPRVRIPESAEQAEKEHRRCLEQNTDAAHIYTDGSGINGQIGAAAVCTTTQQTRKSHMGDDTTSTVYAGELQGIVLALEMAQADKQNGNHRSKGFIHTDNQAAIRSTVKTWSHKQSHQTWQTNWKTETRGRASFRLAPKPTKKVIQLHEGLSKRRSALLVQMRTEKIGLQDFLFSRRVPGITNANCPCQEGRQTVSHILLRCRRFRQLRRQELGGLPGRHNLRVILNKRKAAAKAIRFIEQTEILGQHGIESQPRQS
ncbi:hypothetical protein CSOJ01_16001 [Colletotrichum sojae]|uniref:Zinc knuckle n=1 Tax=Colletotrichum sojae TaxID=2175907 RepID=A0A8H6ILC8_9PEZI|nr:hypothetical protein CSOJ01_16001 [Colletotrichum sojae]